MQSNDLQSSEKAVKSEEEIQAWLVDQVANAVYLQPDEINIDAPFNSYGLSSRDAVLLSGDLEEWLDRRLSPTVIYEYPTIRALAAYLNDAGKAVTINDLTQSSGNQPVGEEIQQVDQSSNTPEAISQLEDIEKLSEDEAELLLLEKLNKLRSN